MKAVRMPLDAGNLLDVSLKIEFTLAIDDKISAILSRTTNLEMNSNDNLIETHSL